MIAKAQEKGVKLLLPTDTVAATEFAADAESRVVPTGAIPDDMEGLDIGPETVAAVLQRRPWRRHRGVERPHGRVRV